MYIHTIVASVLFKTQLLHDTRHFVQSSLALDYSFEVLFFIAYLSTGRERDIVFDWLSGTIFQVFSGGKAISSIDDLREAYLKRERERESL